MSVFIKIYDFLSTRRWLVASLALLVTVALVLLASRLQYHEDIFDFLPQDDEYTKSMQVYTSISEASRIVVIFEGNDPDEIVNAIDEFALKYPDAITEADIDGMLSRLDFIYSRLPYFLTEDSYRLLEQIYQGDTDTLHTLLSSDKTMMSMPGTSFLFPAVATDPLHLVPIAKGISGQYAGAQSAFTTYNGYMMTADQKMGFAFVKSPYGSTESNRNAALTDSLTDIAGQVESTFSSVNIRLLGAPVVAVGNARRIKQDSMFAIIISVVLIVALLLYSFPRKRDIFLIFLSVGFGWLFGMAALSVFAEKVSVIVLGIGAILIGIATNYPLHLLVHQRYAHTVRQTLREVLSPLVTGNITTVGAFLALVPLNSPALRQLGIFAAFMLLGTIIFCIIFLPHLMPESAIPIREIHIPLFEQMGSRLKAGNGIRYFRWGFVAIMAILGSWLLFSGRQMFDSNISHINYMTEQQKKDFAWFESLSPTSNEPSYLSSTAVAELNGRVQRWDEFWSCHDKDSLVHIIQNEAIKSGFKPEAFNPFFNLLSTSFAKEDLNDVSTLAALWPGKFDIESLNGKVSENLTSNFDYLGIACSAVVLIFLCISFKSILVGLIAFVPMLLSWILIIALMQLFGLQFNIVNIILATFIFGQGDDYTIFVVEGILDGRRRESDILAQYKQSILLSALVMLIAIGVLVFASHPAMHSLGAVTLIGMICVVTMAFIVPPMLFDLTYYLKNKLL